VGTIGEPLHWSMVEEFLREEGPLGRIRIPVPILEDQLNLDIGSGETWGRAGLCKRTTCTVIIRLVPSRGNQSPELSAKCPKVGSAAGFWVKMAPDPKRERACGRTRLARWPHCISSSSRRLPKVSCRRLGEKHSISRKGYNEKEGRDWSEIFV